MTTVPVNDNSSIKPAHFPEPNSSSQSKRDYYCSFAKQMENLVIIHALYGALDGLSISYSTIKYFFDVSGLSKNPADVSDVMHDWMMSPAGIAIVTTQSIALIAFSLIANLVDDKAKSFPGYISACWPYVRDSIKGIKNAYKGFRSFVLIADVFTGMDMRYMIIPMGLVMGLLAAMNRIALRYLKTKRIDKKNANLDLVQKILEQNGSSFDSHQFNSALKQLKSESLSERLAGLVCAGYAGIVDGFYLYLGVMSLAVLSTPFFIAMACLSLAYCLGCVAIRVYEVYGYQQEVIASRTKCDLAISSKVLQQRLAQLTALLQTPDVNQFEMIVACADSIGTALQEYQKQRHLLQVIERRSYGAAVLAGLTQGLSVYGAMVCAMIVVSMVCSLLAAPFPPALLIAGVLIGLATVIAFVGRALVENHRHLSMEKIIDNNVTVACTQLTEHVGKLKSKALSESFQVAHPSREVLEKLPISSVEKSDVPGWAEVVRSFFSGLTKGQKSVDYTMNPLQELDAAGHYHESRPMMIFIMASAVLHSISLALRALAKSFGREAKKISSSASEPIRSLQQPHKGAIASGIAESMASPPSSDVPGVLPPVLQLNEDARLHSSTVATGGLTVTAEVVHEVAGEVTAPLRATVAQATVIEQVPAEEAELVACSVVELPSQGAVDFCSMVDNTESSRPSFDSCRVLGSALSESRLSVDQLVVLEEGSEKTVLATETPSRLQEEPSPTPPSTPPPKSQRRDVANSAEVTTSTVLVLEPIGYSAQGSLSRTGFFGQRSRTNSNASCVSTQRPSDDVWYDDSLPYPCGVA